MNFAAQLASVCRGAVNAENLANLARLALAEGGEEQALPWLMRGARQGTDARTWQWTGLLQRALDEHDAALQSFARAARLAPSDSGIAHGRAHVAFEAGIDAVSLFQQARRLSPGSGDVLIGLAAAQMAIGKGEEAAAGLDAVLAAAPLWLQGHMQLAQLRSTIGQGNIVAASLERALSQLPGEATLWRGLFDLYLRRENYAELGNVLTRARTAGQMSELCAEYEAIVASELGAEHADALFDKAPGAAQPRLALWRIRHLLRTTRADQALALIDAELKADRGTAVWPYAAAAWRLTGDPRSAWLEGDERFVVVMNLGQEFPAVDRLAVHLRSLHVAKGEYLDQSVRGGTQTDGPLFSRIDPAIRAVRAAMTRAVERYIRQLPPTDSSHPLLAHRRDRRVRFAGSWSVRLGDAGHHANHVHPQGWISSALYVALPPRQPGEAVDAGWLTLGEPQATLGLDLCPTRAVEPRVAQLVLFPSWMWHGTRPFAEGERLTIAFDVAPPR
ncbi:putative 2OG-Fe(II) oxygenase [Sphingomonas sp. ZT3P38]|uniref:putative 2OG-Fe(II) oxygenase n=1 Tax=Parasphingomonas zepuensis TaxID=3096161 RepID=UPI002FCBC9C7